MPWLRVELGRFVDYALAAVALAQGAELDYPGTVAPGVLLGARAARRLVAHAPGLAARLELTPAGHEPPASAAVMWRVRVPGGVDSIADGAVRASIEYALARPATSRHALEECRAGLEHRVFGEAIVRDRRAQALREQWLSALGLGTAPALDETLHADCGLYIARASAVMSSRPAATGLASVLMQLGSARVERFIAALHEHAPSDHLAFIDSMAPLLTGAREWGDFKHCAQMLEFVCQMADPAKHPPVRTQEAREAFAARMEASSVRYAVGLGLGLTAGRLVLESRHLSPQNFEVRQLRAMAGSQRALALAQALVERGIFTRDEVAASCRRDEAFVAALDAAIARRALKGALRDQLASRTPEPAR